MRLMCLQVFLSIVQRNVRDLFQFDMYATLDPVRFPYHVLHLLSITDSIRLSIATFIWTLLRIVRARTLSFLCVVVGGLF